MSSGPRMSDAPSLMSACGPFACGESILPGSAKTVRLCSFANFAVMSAPDRRPPSMMRTPIDSPEITRFLRGKLSRKGSTSIANSLTTAPEAAISSARSEFSGG